MIAVDPISLLLLSLPFSQLVFSCFPCYAPSLNAGYPFTIHSDRWPSYPLPKKGLWRISQRFLLRLLPASANSSVLGVTATRSVLSIELFEGQRPLRFSQINLPTLTEFRSQVRSLAPY
jgi:hypothetical protein